MKGFVRSVHTQYIVVLPYASNRFTGHPRVVCQHLVCSGQQCWSSLFTRILEKSGRDRRQTSVSTGLARRRPYDMLSRGRACLTGIKGFGRRLYNNSTNISTSLTEDSTSSAFLRPDLFVSLANRNFKRQRYSVSGSQPL